LTSGKQQNKTKQKINYSVDLVVSQNNTTKLKNLTCLKLASQPQVFQHFHTELQARFGQKRQRVPHRDCPT